MYPVSHRVVLDLRLRQRGLALLLCGGLLASALWPAVQARRAMRRATERVLALAGNAHFADGGWLALDPALSLRVQRLGPLLASWETIGGCGAGGANGTGVKWIGHNTTGGLFQLMLQDNYIVIPPGANRSDSAFNNILNLQLSKDLTDRWNVGLSIPFIYKSYSDYLHNGVSGPLTNTGLGDISALVTRRLGPINATSLTGIVGIPTGTYGVSYMGGRLTPDQQLGFGRVTASVMVDHTLDQQWGLIVVGGALSYRGGQQDDKYLWVFDHPSGHNTRPPSASLYAYTGYFHGPLVPALGMTLTGFCGASRRFWNGCGMSQDSRGDFGDTLESAVATAAVHASIEWSNPYVAVLLGTYIPYAIRGSTWSRSAQEDHYGLQPWTLALGVSVSPF
jgi:hypothetical protein